MAAVRILALGGVFEARGEAVYLGRELRQRAIVVPDKAEYAAGDTAELLVQAPFTTGEGYALVLRNGVRVLVEGTRL